MSELPPVRSVSLTGYYGFILIGWNAVLLPSLIRQIEPDLGQSDASFGVLYFVSSLVYTCGAFGGGMLTERLGRRIVLSSAALLLAAGLLSEALAPVWALLIAAAIAVNWGAGVLDAGVNGLFLDLFRTARGGALNRLHLFFSIGALVAPFIAGSLITAGASWRVVIGVTALLAVPVPWLLVTVPMPSGRHDRKAVQVEQVELSGAERSLLPFIGLALSIGLYVAGELGVSNWVVKFLSGAPVATATGILSGFWAGLALGRLLSSRYAERFDYFVFTATCIMGTSLCLTAAVLSPWLPLTAALFALTGFFSGPIYPMIMAMGGNIYPHRLATLSGSLSASAITGSIVYPPLMGLMAAHIGLRGGLLGAALLGIPSIVAILTVRAAVRSLARSRAGSTLPANPP